MFEGALVESRGLVSSSAVRWTAAGSIALQCAVMALIVLLPLLRPNGLKVRVRAPEPIVPPWPRPAPPVTRLRVAPEHEPALLASATPVTRAEAVRGTLAQLMPSAAQADDLAPPSPGVRLAMTGPGMAPQFGNGATAVGVVARAAVGSVGSAGHVGPVRVSSGVSAGMLLTAMEPVYPPIARAAHVQGSVVLEATISKAGRVESVRVLRGPEMLVQSAVDAVRSARYSPYRLNGEAIEVQTTIEVNFRLGS